MRILVAHNAYRYSGGEDAVVEAEVALLRANGHEVETYRRHNDELQTMAPAAAAAAAVWSRRSANDMETLCARFRPDVIHLHNTFPLISPSVLWAAARRRIAVVQSLHNFRLLCPQATFLRDGRICEDCLGKTPWRGVARKCYRGSGLQSAVAAGMLVTHRALGTYRQRIACYIALSAFCRDKFIAGGLPPERIRIKPNFVVAGRTPDWSARAGGLFVGRLSAEKGLDVLAQAVAMLDENPIRLAGSGPLEARARAAFHGNFLGQLPRAGVFELLHGASYLVAPSTCYETFGLALIEAFSCGTPVIASGHGAFADIVTDGVNGLLFKPGDAHALAAKIAWAERHPAAMLAMGRAARRDYEAKYTPQRNHALLMSIYEDAIKAAREERRAA
ncbi:MAG TPA: glycosyltransferase family 4 protein [Paucimonas sp.]|nr:glycosyltransferase family 4 protein [Paucimonas sp.]